jgi:CRP-like cAMP-binding protein/Fe-S-cluster-containing hydrogenase component 2
MLTGKHSTDRAEWARLPSVVVRLRMVQWKPREQQFMNTASAISTSAVPTRRIAELQQLDAISQLPHAELAVLAQFAVLRAFEPHGTIFAERTIARTAYIVLHGAVEQSMRDSDGSEVMISLLGRGDVFGEGGLFGVRYRRTTVRATTRSYVLQWAYADLQAHSPQLPQFFAALRTRFRERLLQTTLARVPLLAPLTPLERLDIAEQLDDQRVERETEILTVGGTSAGLYIIAEGQARVIHNGYPVAVIEPGDVFGEMSLLDNQPHEATIVAWTPVHLLLLPRPTFEYLLDRHPDLARGLRALADQRRKGDRTPAHIATTERLIETGIARGRMVLARETERCPPECKRCEDACADRFVVPRLRMNGEVFGDLQAVDSCHHCRWGAECVEACPEDAFRLTNEGHLVVTERCTGCGACVDACPYDAVSQVPIYPPATNPLTWLLQRTGRQQPTTFRANKCDACTDHDDYACVTACPTGALQWIPVEELYDHHARPTPQGALPTRAP